MDASALLHKQGWLGTGHSLDTSGRGIKRPLLIAHKQDQLGLGKRKAAHTADDQWWMRAFDESLKNIGSGKESTLAQVQKKGINRGGLYGFFVKGEGLAGTVENSSESESGKESDSTKIEGTVTPPTSASENEHVTAAKPTDDAKRAKKSSKRKRDSAENAASKKQKQVSDDMPETKASIASKRDPKQGTREQQSKQEQREARKQKKEQKKSREPATQQQPSSIPAKLAKLSPGEKQKYEERAAAKGQTLDEYVLRRMVKKSAKRAIKGKETVIDNKPIHLSPTAQSIPLSKKTAKAKSSKSKLKDQEMVQAMGDIVKEEGSMKGVSEERKREAKKRIKSEKREALIAKGKG
ncbi:hypothetical protein P280DRAFT_471383 [Massarina eburnea CBS 473.64]|uniref:G-patch domain-containing protein n=1 Tax=Massarina eburnea CBS 473.64 TaxID=1395130 RepID=A0A6A6RT17_9PLEO|nr:hypothetical protein P280DRAFT_471383 [Massarina eburnea CBS 473.64]